MSNPWQLLGIRRPRASAELERRCVAVGGLDVRGAENLAIHRKDLADLAVEGAEGVAATADLSGAQGRDSAGLTAAPEEVDGVT